MEALHATGFRHGGRLRFARALRTRGPLLGGCAILSMLAIPPSAAADPVTLADQTAAAGLAASYVPIAVTAEAIMLGGGAAGDFDRDGWQDLFVLGGGGNADKLFINNRNGTFREEASAWGVAAQHLGAGVAVADYDRDGWPDIYITSAGLDPQNAPHGHNKLYRNNGDGSFTDVADQAGVRIVTSEGLDFAYSPNFGDYDLDGDLDLFVAAWDFRGAAVASRMFRNNNDGTFTDVTDALGVSFRRMLGFSASLVDMNGDRYPELVVAADFQTSRYFVNNRDGTFTDETAASGTGLERNGMGHTIGDFDRDGRPDWYVTSIYVDDADFGNTLYLNRGNDQYDEVARSAGMTDGGWGWGAAAVDLNHDGRLDLLATAGWPNVLSPPYETRVFVNQGAMQFSDANAGSSLIQAGQGRGLVCLDADNDGDQDIVLINYNEPLRFYRNEQAGAAANWIRIFLDTDAAPGLAPHGVGAQVTVRSATAGEQSRWMGAAISYLSQSELSAHFGLGPDAVVDSVRIEWPSGRVTELRDVPANQTLTIATSDACSPDLDQDGRIGLSDLFALLDVFGGDGRGDIDWDGDTDLRDLAILLAKFDTPCP